jgi:aminopeptidase N
VAGQGWVIHDPGYFGEHQVYPEADFDVTLNLVNPPAGLKVAASAPAEAVSGGYHYRLSNARTFAWSASPTYVVQTQLAGDVTILSYNFPLDDAAAKMALKNTADAVTLYSQLFGPYHHATLTVVEADFLDGMEEDGLYFLSKGFYNLYDGTPKGYLTIIAAHETAHQWWFAQVADDQAMEPWLDEALCTYTERIFVENIYPDLVKWWWAFRVDYYSPVGVINQPIYDYSSFINYRNAVYLRGAQFLDALRSQTGDADFFAFLKDYLATEKFKIATASDFFTILAKHTSVDISKVQAGYFK